MRIAVYFAPPPGDGLAVAAAAWLGRDAFTGARLPQRPVPGFPPDELDRLTAEPRRYGFHATLKPPFRLAPRRTVAAVRAAAAAFCAGRGPVVIPALVLSRIGPFFALTPDGPLPPLDLLAADAVRAFDPFRAPPDDAEIARRRPDRLTARQRGYLDAWGYPWVFEEFRFHMTLTGPVPADRAAAMEAVLRHRFAPFLGQPLAVDGIALFVEAEPPGDFVVEARIPFATG